SLPKNWRRNRPAGLTLGLRIAEALLGPRRIIRPSRAFGKGGRPRRCPKRRALSNQLSRHQQPHEQLGIAPVVRSCSAQQRNSPSPPPATRARAAERIGARVVDRRWLDGVTA